MIALCAHKSNHYSGLPILIAMDVRGSHVSKYKYLLNSPFKTGRDGEFPNFVKVFCLDNFSLLGIELLHIMQPERRERVIHSLTYNHSFIHLASIFLYSHSFSYTVIHSLIQSSIQSEYYHHSCNSV